MELSGVFAREIGSFFQNIFQPEHTIIHFQVFHGGAAVIVQRAGVDFQFVRKNLADYSLLDRQFR